VGYWARVSSMLGWFKMTGRSLERDFGIGKESKREMGLLSWSGA
jgi:hypothetical protein